MIKNKKSLILFRLFFGLLGLSAVVTEIIVLVQRGTFNPANFFSFFTIESNIFAAVVLVAGSFLLSKNRHSILLDMLRGGATLYMITTGIVFAVLLSGLDANVLTAVPWDNIVLHYIMPIVLLVDWLLDKPKSNISFRASLRWLIFPLVYVAYSLVRGAQVDWYPYPFLDPSSNGYTVVAITSLGIAITVMILSWLLIRLTKLNCRI